MKAKCYSLVNNKIEEVKLGDFFDGTIEHPLINIYPVEQSKIIGFGGAITESSAYNYSLLSKENKQKVLELLVGETGLKYTLFRLCIGSSDFAIDEFSYTPEKDEKLESFNIERDKKYVIPFIHDLINYSKRTLSFLASPWSPPNWMKDNNCRFKGGKLLKEYYELYSLYLCNFIREYKNEGIIINYLTIQNEQKATQTWESCVFTLEDEVEFANVLINTLKKECLSIKLLAWDHNKERLFERGSSALSSQLFDGCAFHWYSGDHFDAISLMRKLYPSSLLIESEFCRSIKEDYVDSKYSNEHLNVINKGGNGLIDWNLILDENGGPYHNRKAGCDSVIRINSQNNEVVLNSLYNEVWMFTHFINQNSVSLHTSSFNDNIKVSAAKNEDGSIVINLINNFNTCNLTLFINDKFISIPIMENGVYTIVVE